MAALLPAPATGVSLSSLSAAAVNSWRDGINMLSGQGANPWPRCRVRQFSSPQSIPNNAFTAVTFDTEDWNVGATAWHSTGTNPTRFTNPFAATICASVSAVVPFTGDATGKRYIALAVNGVTQSGTQHGWDLVPNGNTLSLTIADEVILTSGDYVEVQVYQNRGSALSLIVTAPLMSRATVRWMP